MTASLLAAVAMLAGKLTAWGITGSDAIFSDAAESVIHIVATGMAAFALWYASRPADPEHLYGHGKIAYFSAGFEGALILLASLAILATATRSILVGAEVRNLGIGVPILAFLTLVNLVLGLTLVKIGKKHDSFILIANGKHVLTDMWTSVGVVAGIAVVWLTGIDILDPVIALAVGLHILRNAADLLRRSFGGLLDQAEAGCTEAIRTVLDVAVRDGTVESFHHVRHRKVNDEVWVELHLLVPGSLALEDAHGRATGIEERLRAALPYPDARVHILTHVEPSDHESAHPGGHTHAADPLAR